VIVLNHLIDDRLTQLDLLNDLVIVTLPHPVTSAMTQAHVTPHHPLSIVNVIDHNPLTTEVVIDNDLVLPSCDPRPGLAVTLTLLVIVHAPLLFHASTNETRRVLNVILHVRNDPVHATPPPLVIDPPTKTHDDARTPLRRLRLAITLARRLLPAIAPTPPPPHLLLFVLLALTHAMHRDLGQVVLLTIGQPATTPPPLSHPLPLPLVLLPLPL
jgi:hypothetical protein